MIDKRLGVAASVVLTDSLADLIDDEMRRLHLPSRSSMIRLCIEEYFAPVSDQNDDDKQRQIQYLEARLQDKDVAIAALQDNVSILKGLFSGSGGISRTKMIEAPFNSRKKKWYQFWK